MQKTPREARARHRRIRADRFIGFRLAPSDYAMLTNLLAHEAISVTAYMRRLIHADAMRTSRACSGAEVPERTRPHCK